MKTIKWGIIGIGRIAEKFATDLLTVPYTQLHAIASNSYERASVFAQKFNVPHTFDSYEAIFQTDLDVIYIATPHVLHHRCTMLCLENNVSVLCEKPFAMNQTEVQEMISTAKQNNLFLMEAMWMRFFPSIKKIQTLINGGRIGAIRTIHADFGFPAPFLPDRRLFNKQLGGGALLDIGIYPVFLSLLFLGYPTDIQGFAKIGSTDVDETTSMVLNYEGATAMLNSTIKVRTNCEAWIYGEKGSIYLHPRFFETKKITLYEEGKEPIEYVFERKTIGYNYEIEEVNNCLRAGKKESDLLPLSMSNNLIKLLDEIRFKTGIIY